jgi:hypothetical protein
MNGKFCDLEDIFRLRGLTEVFHYRLSFRTRGTVSDRLLRERVSTFMTASSIRTGWRSGNAD